MMRNDYRSSEWREYWNRRRSKTAEVASAGQVTITMKGRSIHVVSPHNTQFIAAAVIYKGKWRERSGVWSFPMEYLIRVRKLCVEVYGAEAIVKGGPR